jgi:hypothetical protein
MKKLLLATGAIYGVYMLLKRFNTTHQLATDKAGFEEASIDNPLKKTIVKAKEHHHGDIRKLMKKASVKSHHLE